MLPLINLKQAACYGLEKSATTQKKRLYNSVSDKNLLFFISLRGCCQVSGSSPGIAKLHTLLAEPKT